MTLNWEQVQEEVGNVSSRIAAFLERGRFVGVDGHVVTIGFAKQEMAARGMIENPDNIATLTSIVRTTERSDGSATDCRIDGVGFSKTDDGESESGEGKRTTTGPLRASANTSGRQTGAGNFWRRARRGQAGIEPEGGAGMKNPFGNMGNILKQAQAMQEQMAKLQEQSSSKTVTGTAGGGSVTVTANGAMELVAIVIDPEVVKSGDVEMVQDLVMAASNDALRKAREMMAEAMKSVTGGMNMPGLL